jgi:hypothetical protein
MKSNTISLFTIFTLAGLAITAPATASEPVTIDTFVRAETDTAIRTNFEIAGLGKFFHLREPAPLDRQTVIRMNRDTLYSGSALDLSQPVTITLPDVGDRYMSLHVINQDHYMFVITEPGNHVLTQDMVGTRFAAASVRIFVDADDRDDVAAANAAQDGLKISGGGKGPLDLPEWDQDQLKTAREALNQLATLGFSTDRAFGMPEDTDPIDHLVGAAAGWGGLPRESASYVIRTVEKNDGSPHDVTVKDAPVDAFWSITVYNADGFIDENELGAYSFNNVTAQPNDDGSFTVHFGACGDGRINCLPIKKGWNYAARMYEPRKQILDGDWTFPEPMPLN